MKNRFGKNRKKSFSRWSADRNEKFSKDKMLQKLLKRTGEFYACSN